jgi:hypothetical protein
VLKLRLLLRFFWCAGLELGFLPFQIVDSAAAFFDFAVLLSHNFFCAVNAISNKLAANMKIHRMLFNLNFVFLAAFLTVGCKTPKRVKAEDATHILIFQESHPGMGDMSKSVDIDAPNGGTMYVSANPVLTTAHVEVASAHDAADGSVAIKLQLTRAGKRILENISGAYRGKRLVIQASYPKTEWVGVVVMRQLMGEGELIFFPNTKPKECDRIVSGLNLVIADIKD